MKEKKDEFYYKNLNACIDYSYQAAQFLKETLEQFQIDRLQEQIAEMHEIEQKADTKRHKMTKVLSKAFITPIEREDLVASRRKKIRMIR